MYKSEGYDWRLRRLAANPAMAFAHIFVVTLEALLLGVQYVRMEALAFDFMPEVADFDLGFMYGSHGLGIIWVMGIVLVSYLTWFHTLHLPEQGQAASTTQKAATLVLWAGNVLMMYFEYVLFRMLVEDLDIAGGPLAAKLFGVLMVFTHQVACHWIVSGFFRRRETTLNEKDI